MVQVLRKYLKGDPVIWAVIISLSIFSLLVVYSATGTLAYRRMGGNTTYYLIKQGMFIIMSMGIIFVTHLIPYKFYSRLSQLLYLIAIPLLVFTLFMGTNLNQASRWITLPVVGFTIQSSDFAKLALIMYLARLLSQKQQQIKDFKKGFIPIIKPVIIISMLILPANLSTALIIIATSSIVMFVGRVRLLHLLGLMLTGIVSIALFITVALYVDKEGRIATWKNRIENYFDAEQEDYQVEQAKIAIASGGVLGKGPGNSHQRNFLPHPYSDFIYAIVVEEYGIAGGVFIMFLYIYLFFRAGVVVSKSKKTFPAFLVMGLSLSLVFQAMINIGVAVNLLPVTGQTLPMISMGGSSLMFSSIALGMILSVSRGVKKEEVEEALKKTPEDKENEE